MIAAASLDGVAVLGTPENGPSVGAGDTLGPSGTARERRTGAALAEHANIFAVVPLFNFDRRQK